MGVTTVTTDDLNKAVGANGALSVLDKKLLRYASQRLTPSEMSDRLDGILAPAECAQRVREILRAWDWLSIVEQRALILMDMIELKDTLMDRVRKEGGMVEDGDGRLAYAFGDPRWAAAAIKLLAEMNKLITQEQSNVDVERQGLRRAHAMTMVRAIEMAFDRMSRQLRAEYPQVPEARIRGMLEEALPVAIASVDSAISSEDQIDDGRGGF